MAMSLSAFTRSLSSCLSRPLPTTITAANYSTATQEPVPPRRKGRTPRPDPKNQTLLPPRKLRALVSLYHQSDDFITEDNLLQRIDYAFLHGSQKRSNLRQEHLESSARALRSAPKMTTWQTEAETSFVQNEDDGKARNWSETIKGRERNIIEALYGIEVPSTNAQSLPGYETLMEARDLTQQQNGESIDGVEVFPKKGSP